MHVVSFILTGDMSLLLPRLWHYLFRLNWRVSLLQWTSADIDFCTVIVSIKAVDLFCSVYNSCLKPSFSQSLSLIAYLSIRQADLES